MVSTAVHSITAAGDGATLVDVECHLSNGLPNIIIVGFANKAVDEAKERVRSAFSSSQLNLPRKRITINLAPADLPKDSPGFDLAIAVSILQASDQVKEDSTKDSLFIGELGLDGSIRPVRGIIGLLLSARKQGWKRFFIPHKNLKQAVLIPGITIMPIKTLNDIYLDLTKTTPLPQIDTGDGSAERIPPPVYNYDFSHIVGQARAKRALEIAAAGAHNVLLNGPPGTGKSMLAKALPSILAPLNLDEILEVTHLHSLTTKQFDRIVAERPFRSPHHSSSAISIIGGGQRPRPGEISLSHRGVLFFDEFPEFSRVTIEALRQPLEDKVITVARAKDSSTFPADFILIATCNPCPCGYYGTAKTCSCLPHEIAKYQRKLSGPILDRIDIYIDVDEVKHESLLKDSGEESSDSVRERVINARSRQAVRYGKATKTNSTLTNQEIKRFSCLSSEAETLLNRAATNLDISPRSYMRLIKVARTIADLGESDDINSEHMSEALAYRRLAQNL